jgi:hypothetical protein
MLVIGAFLSRIGQYFRRCRLRAARKLIARCPPTGDDHPTLAFVRGHSGESPVSAIGREAYASLPMVWLGGIPGGRLGASAG